MFPKEENACKKYHLRVDKYLVLLDSKHTVHNIAHSSPPIPYTRNLKVFILESRIFHNLFKRHCQKMCSKLSDLL